MTINQEQLLITLNNFLVSLPNYIDVGWQIFLNWWWLPLPFLLRKPALFFWLWWRNGVWAAKQKQVLLEIRIPKENPKPIRAMEAVFTGIWQSWADPNWIEKWWDGQMLLSFSFELVGIDGVPHFLIRTDTGSRSLIETHIYAQFPEAEIFEVEDYTQKVPQNIPNKDWGFWATDYKLTKKNCYPIKTYRDFETERELYEEKKVDPMASLMESMSGLKKGQQLWVQIRAMPIGGDWAKEGEAIIEEKAHGKKKEKSKTITERIIDVFFGKNEKSPKKDDFFSPEMRLTQGEKEVISGVERKISKMGYEVGIRHICLSKKEFAGVPSPKLVMSYFTNFNNASMNSIVPDGRTIPKARKKWYDPFYFPQRRKYLKQRVIFRRYVNRANYDFPNPGGTFVLNAEELATIFHFPSKALTPASSILRVDAKKGEAPITLPIEE